VYGVFPDAHGGFRVLQFFGLMTDLVGGHRDDSANVVQAENTLAFSDQIIAIPITWDFCNSRRHDLFPAIQAENRHAHTPVEKYFSHAHHQPGIFSLLNQVQPAFVDAMRRHIKNLADIFQVEDAFLAEKEINIPIGLDFDKLHFVGFEKLSHKSTPIHICRPGEDAKRLVSFRRRGRDGCGRAEGFHP